MNALSKHAEGKVRVPVRPTGRNPDANEMYARIMARFPKTMARLGE